MSQPTDADLRARPRVVHLTTTDMSLDWLLAPQLRAFIEAGFEVVGMSAGGPHVPALEAAGVRHVALDALTRSTNPLDDLRAAVQLWRALRVERPDILHTHNPKPGVLGRIAGRLAGVPLIVNTQHGLYAQQTDRWRRRLPVYVVERIAAAFGHVELVQNPEDVYTLVHTLRVPSRRVHLLGNGIDLERFTPTAVPIEVRRRLRAEWGIAPNEVVVGVVGRLVREKGIVEILEAAHRLHADGVPARVVIIGPTDPDKHDAIDGDLFARATADGVILAGRRDDMPECYSAMDLFLTASWREGFPRSAMEAAAMGLPIVATDIRGNRQVVHHGLNGLLVAVRSPEALADAVTWLVAERDRWPTFGAAGIVLAEADFDQRTVIARTLAAYRGEPIPETRR
ncbi:MAG: glycosyltransferase family 4 protein [Ilumatobacteraceae bacterium]